MSQLRKVDVKQTSMNHEQDHSRLYGILGILIYVFYLVGHIPVSELCYFLRDTYSFPIYQYYIVSIGKILLGFLIIWLFWQLRTMPNRVQHFGLWGVFLVGVGYFYRDLIVFDIEYIHFIQYGVFTIVLFHAFKKRYDKTLFVSLLLGFLDEAYQAYQPPAALNWRDVLLNVLGVVAGCLVLLTVEANRRQAEPIDSCCQDA